MQLSGGIGTSITATILAFVQQGTNLYDGTNRGALFVLIFLMFNINIVILSQYFAFKLSLIHIFIVQRLSKKNIQILKSLSLPLLMMMNLSLVL